VRLLSFAAIAAVIGCGGDSSGTSNALPAVQGGAASGEKPAPKEPDVKSKKAGNMGPQKELGALKD